MVVNADLNLKKINENEPASAALGFELLIDASNQRVYQELFPNIRKWWPQKYSLHPTPVHFEIINDNRVGGCVYERWNDDKDGALWGHIISIKENSWFEVTGPMGVKGPINGLVEFTCSETTTSETIFETQHIGVFNSQAHIESVGLAWSEITDCIVAHLLQSGVRVISKNHEPIKNS